jgi:hypothetical protein
MHVPISARTRQHFVDAKNVEGVHTDSQVERVLASSLCHILISADTGSLECFTRELLIFIRDKVTTEGEFIDRSTLPAEVKNTNLRRDCVSDSVATVLTTSAP